MYGMLISTTMLALAVVLYKMQLHVLLIYLSFFTWTLLLGT